MRLYHGSKTVIKVFDRHQTVDGGFHFGTRAQATMRVLGGTSYLIEAEVEVGRSRRSRDTGGEWKAKIKAAKSAGYDSIVYLNRYEGITLASIQAAQAAGVDPDALSDAEFRKWFPEAEDSYIVFDPAAIRVIQALERSNSHALEAQAEPGLVNDDPSP